MSVATKLNVKPGQSVCVLHAPQGVDLGWSKGTPLADDPAEADAVILFVTDRSQLAERQGPLVEAARRDALAWVAYPKARQLGTDLNRDLLWQDLQGREIRPVRQVSVDDVWSALRFRPA